MTLAQQTFRQPAALRPRPHHPILRRSGQSLQFGVGPGVPSPMLPDDDIVARPVVFECVGVPGMLQGIIQAIPRHGLIVVVGVCMQPDQILPAIATDRGRRRPGEATANAERQLAMMREHLAAGQAAVISGASGAAATTAEEVDFLRGLALPVRGTATAFGHSLEPSFPANLALAALAVSRGRLFGPLEAGEAVMDGDLRRLLVTSWGHWRGEALAVVEAA